MKKTFLRIMVILLLTNMLMLVFNIQQAKSSEPPAIKWSRTYGGTDDDAPRSVVETDDGGYALAGVTESFGAGGKDFWLVKTDWTGNMQWSRTYGETNDDSALSMVQTSDGGYAIVGYTRSFGAGIYDYWLVKIDAAGDAQWNRTYGGPNRDEAWSVVRTGDGGYAIVGWTESFGAGGYDFWLIKTNSTGHMEWNQTYGGANHDVALSMVQTSDGGYALAGYTHSFGPGGEDFWLIKTDSSGNSLWSKTYGGTRNDAALSVIQASDGGYMIAGYTYSFGAGICDYWLVKTDSSGNMEWNKTYGGTDKDYVYRVVQTCDGGYAIAGGTKSFGAGNEDFWLVKTNSTGHLQWSRTYGGTNADEAWSVIETSEGGYAIGGWTASFGAGGYDFWLIKLAGPSPRMLKESALTELEPALLLDPGDDDLIQAIDYLHMSLGDERGRELGSEVIWIDDWHVNETKGVDTFQYEEEASDKLDAYVLNDENVDTGVASIIETVKEKLYEADRLLAEKAIEEAEAAGGVQSEIDKAEELYRQALDTYAAGTHTHTSPKLSDVMDLFEEAWEKAVSSY